MGPANFVSAEMFFWR